MKLERTVTVQKPLHEVFAYLSDFTTTTEWDPGTVTTVRTAGDGEIGTEYENTSTFAGRQTRLIYVVEDLVPNERIALRGENSTVIARDIMTFRATSGDPEGRDNAQGGSPDGDRAEGGAAESRAVDRSAAEGTASGRISATAGTQVTYTADFTFKGLTKLIAPLMKPAFTKLGNEAEAGMAAALERL